MNTLLLLLLTFFLVTDSWASAVKPLHHHVKFPSAKSQSQTIPFSSGIMVVGRRILDGSEESDDSTTDNDRLKENVGAVVSTIGTDFDYCEPNTPAVSNYFPGLEESDGTFFAGKLQWFAGRKGEGKLCKAKYFTVSGFIKVWRIFSSDSKTPENPDGRRYGSWWSLEDPSYMTTKEEFYRVDDVCKDWSPNPDLYVSCSLKVGTKVAIGPGQSAACKDGSLIPPSSHMQVYIDSYNDKSMFIQCSGDMKWPTQSESQSQTIPFSSDIMAVGRRLLDGSEESDDSTDNDRLKLVESVDNDSDESPEAESAEGFDIVSAEDSNDKSEDSIDGSVDSGDAAEFLVDSADSDVDNVSADYDGQSADGENDSADALEVDSVDSADMDNANALDLDANEESAEADSVEGENFDTSNDSRDGEQDLEQESAEADSAEVEKLETDNDSRDGEEESERDSDEPDVLMQSITEEVVFDNDYSEVMSSYGSVDTFLVECTRAVRSIRSSCACDSVMRHPQTQVISITLKGQSESVNAVASQCRNSGLKLNYVQLNPHIEECGNCGDRADRESSAFGLISSTAIFIVLLGCL